MRSLAKLDLGDRIRLHGVAAPLIDGHAAPDSVVVRLGRRHLGDTVNAGMLTATLSGGGWEADWTPDAAGVWVLRVEASVGGAVVAAEEATVTVRVASLPSS